MMKSCSVLAATSLVLVTPCLAHAQSESVLVPVAVTAHPAPGAAERYAHRSISLGIVGSKYSHRVVAGLTREDGTYDFMKSSDAQERFFGFG